MRPIVCLVLCLSGCGGSSPNAAVDRACGDLAGARCNKRQSCSSGASLTRLYGDMDTCLIREKLNCTAGLAAPASGRTPNSVESCAASYSTLSCSDFLDSVTPAACQLGGTLTAGQVCTFGAQCMSGFCVDNKTSLCGTCGAPPLAGASCMSTGCADNQACVGATLLCQPYGALGDACDDTHFCGAGLSCFTANGSASCQAAGEALGASCGGKLPGCDPVSGFYCAGPAGAKTCAAIAFVGDGMPCGNLADGTTAACRTGGCYTSTGLAFSGQLGACKAAAADGAACDTALGPSCLAPARCVVVGSSGTSGVCTVPDATVCR